MSFHATAEHHPKLQQFPLDRHTVHLRDLTLVVCRLTERKHALFTHELSAGSLINLGLCARLRFRLQISLVWFIVEGELILLSRHHLTPFGHRKPHVFELSLEHFMLQLNEQFLIVL